MNSLKHYLRPPAPKQSRVWIAIAVLAAMAGGLGWQAWQIHTAAMRAEGKLARIQAKRSREVPPPARIVDPAEQKRWAAMQVERAFSWSTLFGSVEKSANEDVELLAFEPDKANRTVLLKGEARDQTALLAFLEALARQPKLTKVHLTQQKQRKKREQLDTIEFEVKAGITDL